MLLHICQTVHYKQSKYFVAVLSPNICIYIQNSLSVSWEWNIVHQGINTRPHGRVRTFIRLSPCKFRTRASTTSARECAVVYILHYFDIVHFNPAGDYEELFARARALCARVIPFGSAISKRSLRVKTNHDDRSISLISRVSCRPHTWRTIYFH